jgi:hypothetical protein
VWRWLILLSWFWVNLADFAWSTTVKPDVLRFAGSCC